MRNILLVLFLILVTAPAAWAQTGKHLALGAALSYHRFADDDFSVKNPGIKVIYRFRLKPDTTSGWKWGAKTSFSLGNTDVRTDIGGIPTHLGKLRTIPLLIGVDRTYRQGRWSFGASVVAGPSFNHFDVDTVARSAYLTRLGSNLGSVTVKTSIAAKPALSVWCDLGKWAALHASLSYVVNRPNAKMTIDGVTTSSTWKTDHASCDLGFVVGIF